MKSVIAKIVVGLLLLALLAFAGLRILQSQRAQQTAAAAPAPPVVLELPAQDIVPIRKAELQRSVEFSGSVRAAQSAFVKARVAAEIRTLSVREGDTVRTGQVLVQQDTTEFDWRVRQADQQAQSAKAQLDIAQRALANNKALVAQGFISPTALESSVSNEAAALANLQATLAGLEIARKSKADATLTAPMGGLISQRLVQPGERVGVDARLLEIVDLSQLEIEASLAPEDVAVLRIGQTASVSVDGIAPPIKARVVRINPSAQAGSRSIPVYLALDRHPALRHGLFARGRIELERVNVLALPSSAVRMDRAEPYVLQLAGDAVRAVNVRLGLRGSPTASGEELVEINLGLGEGAQVLAGTAGAVAEGTRWKTASTVAPALKTPASAPR